MAKGPTIWHVNVGAHVDDAIKRNWDDERRYRFVTAGQGPKWAADMQRLDVGDTVYVYLNKKLHVTMGGYVAKGTIVSRAVPAPQFVPPGSSTPLADRPNLKSSGWFTNGNDPLNCEWMAGVEWTKTVDACGALTLPTRARRAVCRIQNPAILEALREAFG